MRRLWTSAARAVALLTVLCSELCLAGLCRGAQAERCVDAQLQVVQSLGRQLEHVADLADESASRLSAGGSLYLAGEKGMVSELLGRAGGLCAAKALPLDQPLPSIGPQDVILLSDYGAPGRLEAAVGSLAPTEAMIIVFAPAEHPLLKQPLKENLRAVPVDIPLDSRVVTLPSGERLIPRTSPAMAIAQWTYTAELLGACRRQGKQLAVYLSIFLDEGRRRYERTKGLLFEPELKPDPVPRTQYARAFLTSVEKSLKGVRNAEMDHIRTAAAWLREARAGNRKIVRNLQGHLPPTEVGAPGDAPFFAAMTQATGDPGQKWIEENLHEGDVYVFVGYQKNEDAMAAAANRLGARTVFLTSAAPGAEQAKNPRHVYIDPHWPQTDGCLELPGYDVKACPLSCILGMTCYGAICAEALSPGR